MPSIKSLSLAAAGLVSMVSAFPQGGFQNTTTNAGGNTTSVVPVGGNGANPGSTPVVGPTNGGTVAGSGNGTEFPRQNGTFFGGGGDDTTAVGPTAGNRTSDNSFFCPRLSGAAFTNGNGASFLIECDSSHFGVVININIAKRQAVLPTNLGDCLSRCDNVAGCVGTAFNSGLQTCTFFSEVGAAFRAPGVSFGVRVGSGPAASVAAGATLTSTILQTKVVTISSCAPTVTNCPIGAVVTQVQAVSTTQYICPTATIVPVAPVACGCAYGVSTVAGYKSTVTLGSTILIPVTSTVVAVPKPSVTEYKFTTGVAVCPTCPGGAVSTPATTRAPSASATTVCPGGCKTNGTSTATSSMVVFKGAADQVKAGMGMGAIVAAAALLL